MEQEHKHLPYWLALHRTPKLSPNQARQLLTHFTSIIELFQTSRQDLLSLGLNDKACDFILSPDWQRIEEDMKWLAGINHHLIHCNENEFPKFLQQIQNHPLVLFIDGNKGLLGTIQLSMVGSRHPTAAGKRITYDFAQHLVDAGFTVTSGLALGIDAESHRGALAAGGKTIAVLGNGIDNVYPVRHRKLANEIKENGAVLSEFPPSTPPLPQNFPQRNRIISGLSVGTLVVEAAERSGSLITANLANEQGREVFAVPGSVLNPLSAGCHRLLKQGAKLTETVDDILDELNPDIISRLQVKTTACSDIVQARGLDNQHQSLLDLIGFDPISVDSLVELSGLTAETVSSMLLNIELEGHIQSQMGGRYMRITRT